MKKIYKIYQESFLDKYTARLFYVNSDLPRKDSYRGGQRS